MKIALYCICGAGAEGEVAPAAAALTFKRVWCQEHWGTGHAECDRATAARKAAEDDRKGPP